MRRPVVAIHQPNLLPWLGWFAKAAQADVLVLLDDVQLSRPSPTTRVRFKAHDGVHLLTVPLRRGMDVRIDAALVALSGVEVAGSCLGNAKTIEWPNSGKVGSLSIRRPFRRRGVARALIYHALGKFYQHGIRRVITDTDANSFTGADRLYQQIGMRVYRREHLYEKVLRPGTELRILAPA